MAQKHQLKGMMALECQLKGQQTTDRQTASDLTAVLAKDLAAILPMSSEETGLAVACALYPVEQILQPKWPVHHALNQYASAAFQGESQQNKMLSIGANNDLMPAGLQPVNTDAPLLMMPFVVFTDDETLHERFEQDLMHKGMISPGTYQVLNQAMGLEVNHANYMTHLDLVAMMHNHYQQLGQDSAWHMIEHAALQQQAKARAHSDQHNHYYLVDHLLFTPLFSMPQMAAYFDATPGDYVDWLVQQRTAMAAFDAHGLETHAFQATQWPLSDEKICLGSLEKQRLTGDFWVTCDGELASDQAVELTFIESQKAGLVAIRVQAQSQQSQLCYYPLHPAGINAIEQHIKQQFNHIAGHQVHVLEESNTWPL